MRNAQNLKMLSPDDRPREKLLQRGASHLSDSEIVAVLLGSGNHKETALDLSRRLLNHVNQDLLEFGRLTVADFQRFMGIGEAKTATLLAAIELGRRRRAFEVRKKSKIQSSKEVYEHFVQCIGDLAHEEFWAMFLSRNNHIVSLQRLSEGGFSATVVDPKRVFHKALEHKAAAVIVAHNHPSGNLQPSLEDKRITKKLFLAGRHLDLPILDHLIITNQGYFSFSDEGILDAE
jgi:DNA repair protein RadC